MKTLLLFSKWLRRLCNKSLTNRVRSLVIPCLILFSATTHAAPPNFEEQVRPIFKEHCTNCHNPDKKKADLDLTSTQGVQIGSSGGEVVKAGLPDTSVLYMVMNHHEDFDAMPPKKPKVPKAQLKIVRDWIAGGLIESADGKSQLREMSFDVSTGSSARPESPYYPKDLPQITSPKTHAAAPIIAMAASPSAEVIATSGHEEVHLFGRATPESEYERIGTLPFPEGSIYDLRFSRNGQLLVAAGGRGGFSGQAVIFDLETGKRQAVIGDEQDIVLSADISADHGLVAIGTPAKRVKIFSTKDGKLLHNIEKHTDWVTAVRFSPDGKLIASGDRNGGIHVWEADNAGIVYTLDEHKVKVTSLAWRSDSKLLASAGEDGKFVLWDVTDGWPTRSVQAHDEKSESRYSRRTGILDIAYSPQGNITTIGRDRAIRLWKTDGAKDKDSEISGALPTQIAILSDGTSAVVGNLSGDLRIWDLDSLTVRQEIPAE